MGSVVNGWSTEIMESFNRPVTNCKEMPLKLNKRPSVNISILFALHQKLVAIEKADAPDGSRN